jgi:hypothetical protein
MQSINDAESLHKFRGQLDDLVNELNRRLKETEDSIDTVSRTWQDGQFKNFCKKFEEDKKEIEPLGKKIHEFESDFLARLEKHIRKYNTNI